MKQTIGILGVGRLGGSLAASLRALGLAVRERRRDDVVTLEAWAVPCNCLIITVRDDQIAEAVDSLTNLDLTGKQVLMCSGAVPLSVLAPLAERGAVTGKLHPLQAFTEQGQVPVPRGTPWACEGPIQDLVAPWVEAWEGTLHALSGDDWAIYHAAAVTAANFLPLFIRAGARLLGPLAADRDDALAWLAPLVQTSVAAALDPKRDLPYSGPAVRGDQRVLDAQIALLKQHDPRLAELYRLASEAIAAERNAT